MVLASLCENDQEEKQHSLAIRELADKSGIDEAEVIVLYECVLSAYKTKARVKTFLNIFVNRDVRAMLGHRAGSAKLSEKKPANPC